jgi:hypothetical protein
MTLTPDDFTFGVEIECYLPVGKTHADLAAAISAAEIPCASEIYNHAPREAWKVVTDGSLGDYSRGAEVVSPVLKGPEGLDAVRRAAIAIQAFGATVDRRCGLHVHVGVPEGRRPGSFSTEPQSPVAIEFMKRVGAIYAKHEPAIDGCLAPSRRVNNYCKAVGWAARAASAETLQDLQRVTNNDRYCKVNLMSYWRHGTVEFRQHSGTVESNKIINWIRFCLALASKATDNGHDVGLVSAVLTQTIPVARGRRLHGWQQIQKCRVVNPKRRGSAAHRLWELYRDGMTVSEALEAAMASGFTYDRVNGDLNYNISRGLMNLVRIETNETVNTSTGGVPALAAELDLPEDLTAYLAARTARFAHIASAE